MASLSATKGLPPPFVMTRSYIETLEDRRDEVRDLVMEREARLAECHRIAEEITNLWEQLNTPVENRINLDIDVNCLEKYQEMSRALRDQWQSARQGEADKERLQIVRNELIDLKDDEFQVQDFNSSQEVWATLERLVSEKVRRINHLANLAGELYMLYTTPPSPGIPENSLQDILLKSFLITLPGTLPSPLSLEALQGRTKELLTSSFTRNRALPEPLSIERKYALEIEAKINALKKTIKEKAEKEEQVRRLIIDIHALWDELSVPHKDRVELVEFVDKIKEYTTIAQKLRRKWSESKKREIDEAVARLKAVYEECGVSQEEQDAFWERNNPIYSPTSLAEMLKEIASVTMRKESGVKIYKAIEDRKEFLKKLIEFEKAAGDPSRLFSGSSLRLLEEEKLRKSALPTLKQMENRLRKMLNDYEEDTNYSFMLNGRPYVEILDEEVKARLSNSTILVFFSSKKS
ncbi:hypothetical protein BC830DRAFT_215506 [Chytriomyces sp. MP71]|nr:hypothetical protein BC830DRAFT_215506 [Chytriomyces sp. MP71]